MHKMAELFRKDFPEGALVHLAHAGNLEGARALGELLRAEGVQIISTLQAGAAVSVHTCPGTIAFFAGPRR
jgi:fatty acid-binding protein DegV